MQDFEYVQARDEVEVTLLLSGKIESAYVLSGGTDLIAQLREGRRQAKLLVDIKHVPAANELTFDLNEGLRLGAAVPCTRICRDLTIYRTYPGLIDAVALIGGTQIQNRASVGGNLCNASPAADTIPALIVHRATCVIAGSAGRREVAVEDFCTGPGTTLLEAKEFLVSLRIPTPATRSGAAYLRFIPRNEMDIAVVGAAASVTLDPDLKKFESARIALGAVAPTPLFVREAGEFLRGQTVSAETIAEASRIAQAWARPISDMRGTAAQRKHLAAVLTRRALKKAVERAGAAAP